MKHDKAYQKGRQAKKRGMHISTNPYSFGIDGRGAWAAWRKGFRDEQQPNQQED